MLFKKSLRLLTVSISYLHLHITFCSVPFFPLSLSHFSLLKKPVSHLLLHLLTFNIFHTAFPFCIVYSEIRKKELMLTELLTSSNCSSQLESTQTLACLSFHLSYLWFITIGRSNTVQIYYYFSYYYHCGYQYSYHYYYLHTNKVLQTHN